MKKLVCTVLALVFVGAVAIGGSDQAVYATSSPSLDAIVAGSATTGELGSPMWWTWKKFFKAAAAVVTVVLAAGTADGGGTQYAGVSEAVFD